METKAFSLLDDINDLHSALSKYDTSEAITAIDCVLSRQVNEELLSEVEDLLDEIRTAFVDICKKYKQRVGAFMLEFVKKHINA